MDHLRFVAGGDDRRFQYILHWLGLTVQNPARRAEVALVFRGEKGCGKGSHRQYHEYPVRLPRIADIER